MKNVTINYAKSWLMGIDPVATGRQLKKLRRDHGITQEFLSELFERCGDSASRVIISMWETGKKLPSLSHMVFLAELYGCSLDELVISYRRSRETEDDDQLVQFLLFILCLALGEHMQYCMCSPFLVCIPMVNRSSKYDLIFYTHKAMEMKTNVDFEF